MINNAKKDLYDDVEVIRSKYIINPELSYIDSVEVCKREKNFDLFFHNFNTHGICGTALIGDKVNSIILNSSRNKIEQNFDCAHEIIHCSLHRNYELKVFNCFEKVMPTQNRFIEWQANEGAAELLMPYKNFIQTIINNKDNLKFNLKRFQQIIAYSSFVPDVSVFYRFESLKYEIQQALDGVPIEKIEMLSNHAQLERGIIVKSLNDLFLQ